MRRSYLIIAVALGVLAVAGVAYEAIVPGLSSARQEPSGFEVEVATYLLHHSLPDGAVRAQSPLGARPDPAAIRAGHDLFAQKCEVCHAYDGGGKTEIGAGAFPRPPALKSAALSMSDGEIFYHIRNGIRNTAMPAWNFPDRQVWQLVAYIRNLAIVAQPAAQDIAARQAEAVLGAHYVGS